MRFGFGYGMGFAAVGSGKGGGEELPAIQVVTNRGESHHVRAGARTAANNLQVARTRHYVGSVDVTEMAPVFQDYYVPDTPLAETNGEGYTVRFNIEYNGLSIPGAFGGERDGVVPAGSAWFEADPVPASAFGLETFPANAQFWLRAERQYAVGAGSLFNRTTAYTTPITDERYMSAAAGTATLLNATGTLTSGGAWTAQTHVWLPLCFIGQPVAPMMAVGVFGASIEHGSNDSAGDGQNGGGSLRRAMFDLNGSKIARISLAKPGESAFEFLNSHAKRIAVLPYLTHALIGYGGNDYTNGSTIEDTLDRLEQLWDILHQGGAPYVAQIAFAPKTDSSDAWATVANQTPRTGYAVGAPWYVANATMAANPALDGFLNARPAMVDAVSVDKWKAAATTDGTHPSSTIHIAMATEAKTFLAGLLPAVEATIEAQETGSDTAAFEIEVVDDSPAPMFENGELGGWYDPSDLSTLFQDSAMTTPVAADGDPVGAIMDKSGNDIHLLQATSGARPTYRTAGGLHWLEFTTSVDFLASTATFAMNTAVGDYYIGTANDAVAGSVFITVGSSSFDRITLTNPFGQFRMSGDVMTKSLESTGLHYTDVLGTASAGPTLADFDMEVDGVNASDIIDGGPSALNISARIGLSTLDFSTPGANDTNFYGGIVVLRTMSVDDRAAMRAFFGEKVGL